MRHQCLMFWPCVHFQPDTTDMKITFKYGMHTQFMHVAYSVESTLSNLRSNSSIQSLCVFVEMNDGLFKISLVCSPKYRCWCSRHDSSISWDVVRVADGSTLWISSHNHKLNSQLIIYLQLHSSLLWPWHCIRFSMEFRERCPYHRVLSALMLVGSERAENLPGNRVAAGCTRISEHQKWELLVLQLLSNHPLTATDTNRAQHIAFRMHN